MTWNVKNGFGKMDQYLRVAETYGPGTLAMHGVSKSVVGLQDGMTYGSIAAANNAFIEFTVQPVLNLLADEETSTVQAEEGPAFTVGLEADRAHAPELRESQIRSDIDAGALTVGELRELRGRPKFGDERDDMNAGSESIRSWSPSHPEAEGRTRASSGELLVDLTATPGVPAGARPAAKSLLASQVNPGQPPRIASSRIVVLIPFCSLRSLHGISTATPLNRYLFPNRTVHNAWYRKMGQSSGGRHQRRDGYPHRCGAESGRPSGGSPCRLAYAGRGGRA